ncbi:hypothetical protein [Pleomorphomonas oryzae]|uniref:hypothetical protein n=1 Tax=Pleomorphomonas oryzae TaxID=261934 RepID=UPI000402D949|nr:hypothetical protein [Pleomorphomonas oryzae]
MVCNFAFSAFLPAVAATAVFALSSTAGAVEVPSVASQGAPVCLVGLGSDDGSPAWSQLDVTPNRSVDLDLSDGAGLTVACGSLSASKYRPATAVAPVRAADPSAKGDFGSL